MAVSSITVISPVSDDVLHAVTPITIAMRIIIGQNVLRHPHVFTVSGYLFETGFNHLAYITLHKRGGNRRSHKPRTINACLLYTSRCV